MVGAAIFIPEKLNVLCNRVELSVKRYGIVRSLMQHRISYYATSYEYELCSVVSVYVSEERVISVTPQLRLQACVLNSLV